MKKIFYSFLTLIFVCCFSLNISINKSYASESMNKNIEIKDESYLNQLIKNNSYLQNKIKELEHNNIEIDNKVRSLNGVDFIYYHNNDKSKVGLIEIHKDLISEVRVNSNNNSPDTIEFIKSDNSKLILGKDEQGQFKKVIYKSPSYKSPWWCPYVIGLVGTSVSSLYTAVAGMIGGPIAAVIVAGVSSVGWTFVTNQC